ncbi:hypothetical protein D3C78_1924110 [compost metagenome]
MYVGANALVAVFSYLVIVGTIKRVELREDAAKSTDVSAHDGDAKLVESRH